VKMEGRSLSPQRRKCDKVEAKVNSESTSLILYSRFDENAKKYLLYISHFENRIIMHNHAKVITVGLFSDEDVDDQNSDITVTVEWRHRHLLTLNPVAFRKSSNISLILTKKLDFEAKRFYRFKVIFSIVESFSFFKFYLEA